MVDEGTQIEAISCQRSLIKFVLPSRLPSFLAARFSARLGLSSFDQAQFRHVGHVFFPNPLVGKHNLSLSLPCSFFSFIPPPSTPPFAVSAIFATFVAHHGES